MTASAGDLAIEGYVYSVRDGIAYVTLALGEERFYGQVKWDRLYSSGVRERRRFLVRFPEEGEPTFEDIPDIPITDKMMEDLDKRLEELFPRAETP